MRRRLDDDKMVNMNLDNLQDDTMDTSTLDGKTILQLITDVNNVLYAKGMDEEGQKECQLAINALARRQGLTAKQAFILAVVTNFYIEDGANMNDITNLCKCDNMSIVQLLPEIDQLVAEGYLTMDCRMSTEYNLDSEVMDAYRENKAYKPKSFKCEDMVELLASYYDLTHSLYENDIDHKAFYYRYERFINENMHLPIIKALKELNLYTEIEVIILNLCRHLVIHNTTEVPARSMAFLIPEGCKRNNFMGQLQNGRGVLLKKGIVEYAGSDGMRDRDNIRLTKKTRKQLLGNFKMKDAEEQSDTTCLVRHKNVAEKKLFFDDRVGQQVDQLRDLLSERHFKSIQRRLKEKGLRTGFSCLFYGAPGTGKTETALQLARATGRDIMQVNISQIRSMWVGESEKNIQGLFDDYREQVKAHKRCPILLFNEADAIFNQRNEDSKRSVDKMENSIQNIILQEMEKLDGILIATTNLQGNLDKAFERRFLYKVEFARPNLEARTCIWRALMPTLDDITARQLARDYDLSGGQIENVARKTMIDEILHGEADNRPARIRQYCDDEKLDKGRTLQIGFATA